MDSLCVRGDQFPITINLVVKAGCREEAVEIARKRLVTWFLDPEQQTIIPNYGYPDGSLLLYDIEERR